MGQLLSFLRCYSKSPVLTPGPQKAPESRPRVANVNHDENLARLRWVDNEYIYFVDIPWSDPTDDIFPSSSIAPQPLPSVAPRTTITLRSLTVSVLEDMMDATIPGDVLLSQTACKTVISGERLSRLVVPWARRLCALRANPVPSFTQRGQQVRETLLRVLTAMVQSVYPRLSSLVDQQSPEARLLCALVTFLSSLGRCMRAIWEDDTVWSTLERQSKMYRDVVDIFQNRLEEHWGAQFRVAIQLGGGLPFLAYIVSCQPTSSKVLTVDTRTYRPQHATPDCACQSVAPPITDVHGLLEENKIPVLVFDGSRLSVRSACAGPYVAISHVWADGLGSTTEAGLPICQVHRIAQRARELVPDGTFWIDALCVPSERDLRRKAIVLMANTYEQADKVLVVDGGVRAQCSLSTPKEDCILRIATSGWMQRIWTLQEGMLARELYFELSDGIIDCTFFNGPPYCMALESIPLLGHRPRDDTALRFERRTSKPVRCTLNDIIALLRYRSTSKPEDEPIAISGLLGVDAAIVVNFNTQEERMKALLMHVGSFNRHLVVFGWFCDRLSLPNFTWAPASLNQVLWPGDPDDPRVATCDEEGLLGEFCVVHFPPVRLGINWGVVVIVDDNNSGGSGSNNVEAQERISRDVFNLILTPYFFRSRNVVAVWVNAILLRGSVRSGKLWDEGVAVVMADIPGHGAPTDGVPLHCQFVASGSLSTGLPEDVESFRNRSHWVQVPGREMVYRKVRLT
ncbi:hypothetical protein BD414DRAFT_461964 [Trametes punicea]|nr:hypothetical protein BD414DRAFT_461964 [Trametes punicea]